MILKPTELRRNLYRILDRVLATGTPVEVDRDGERLKIAPVDMRGRLDRLVGHPEAIACDPEEIVEIDWSSQWRPSI
ncbi:MAG: type II toxin-antitoxin system Phd/YefM family antitoxin [Gemmatimonadota bacterium]|nr:type II toxin-antitoxin system Phd/YefM family antitoxin [Gemmatimonadota bacterium]